MKMKTLFLISIYNYIVSTIVEIKLLKLETMQPNSDQTFGVL